MTPTSLDPTFAGLGFNDAAERNSSGLPRAWRRIASP